MLAQDVAEEARRLVADLHNAREDAETMRQIGVDNLMRRHLGLSPKEADFLTHYACALEGG